MLDEISGTKKVLIALAVSGAIILIFVAMILANKNDTTSTVTKLPSGVSYVVTQKSDSGQSVKKASLVDFNYTVTLEDGTLIDTNDGSDPISSVIGDGKLIPGVEEGMIGMKVGEKRKLTIPAAQAYGSQDVPGIPPNSTLIFDIEVTEVQPN